MFGLFLCVLGAREQDFSRHNKDRAIQTKQDEELQTTTIIVVVQSHLFKIGQKDLSNIDEASM